ncbi:MAG: hypothetical protein K8F91_03925 [Candidatus Obscuribacterales bacterium]|nr:hypothetical protein [Candidatus Obscuribacterales bacterium]
MNYRGVNREADPGNQAIDNALGLAMPLPGIDLSYLATRQWRILAFRSASMTAIKRTFHLRDSFDSRAVSEQYGGDEPPLRSELFSAEQMEKHGKILAGLHQLISGSAPDQLLVRLAENESVILHACNLLTDAVSANRRITPAGEWLLDNFYLIEEQIATARRHLPRGYSRQLPRLANGDSAGFPRVYDLALATISHGDGRVDPENLSRFVSSYQTVSALKLGELWAIPIMLRLALIENLRRVGVRIAAHMIERDLADNWADQMMEVAASDPKNLILVIADMARSNPPMVSSFVSELARRLQGQSSALAVGLTWIEQQLSESSQTIEQMVQTETQLQATDQVSISNSIGSLRFLGAMDWRNFVEDQSVVEQILLEDPRNIYGQMDFGTRDNYRHVIEKIARKSDLSEGEIARKAIDLAKNGSQTMGSDDRSAHAGFYLIAEGLPALERASVSSHSITDGLQKIGAKFPLFFYLGSIFAITCLLSFEFLAIIRIDHLSGQALLFVGMVFLVCTSKFAVSLVNWLATMFLASKSLPKMDFSAGIPKKHVRLS